MIVLCWGGVRSSDLADGSGNFKRLATEERNAPAWGSWQANRFRQQLFSALPKLPGEKVAREGICFHLCMIPGKRKICFLLVFTE